MRRYLLGFYIAIFFTVLVCPTIQNALGLFPSYKLIGVEKPISFPKLNLDTWNKVEFQSGFDSWYKRYHGLRDVFVRTDNQINFVLFHRISTQQKWSLVLGKDNYLYERPYVYNYLKLDTKPEPEIRDIVRSIKSLQDKLSKAGVAFLFLISPSKATIYPEFIPDYYLERKQCEKRSNYEIMVPFLKEFGVRFLDGQQFISELKQTTNIPLFPRGGTHWNFYASYKMALKLWEQIELAIGKRVNRLTLEKIVWDDIPRFTDPDLAWLANLWDPTPFYEKYPYPLVNKKQIAGAIEPSVLFVGASFSRGLVHYLVGKKVVHEDSKRLIYTTVQKIVDLEKEILNRDIIVLEASVLELKQIDRGFVYAALSAFNNLEFRRKSIGQARFVE